MTQEKKTAGHAGNLLGRTLTRLIKERSRQGIPLELGTVNADMSIQLDTFAIPIPAGDYLIARTLTLGEIMTSTTAGEGSHPHGPSGAHAQYSGDGTHSHPDTEGAHQHTIPTPEQMKALIPGDRVLCAWVNGGTDVVVIDVVVSS